ncbi:hypothetical protein AtubIFM55763_005988 [Aspergillus tubingensis]|nr:hypothetical protein AtubIFM54640_001970 [Aspergillus tubingensis]GLA74742.1 hypothetical protein AtubIFM55763_005988 [Aspergillus tubingensis]
MSFAVDNSTVTTDYLLPFGDDESNMSIMHPWSGSALSPEKRTIYGGQQRPRNGRKKTDTNLYRKASI